MSAPSEELRDVFAAISALGFIMRGVPSDDVPKEAYAMADRMLEAREPEIPVGLPPIKRRRTRQGEVL